MRLNPILTVSTPVPFLAHTRSVIPSQYANRSAYDREVLDPLEYPGLGDLVSLSRQHLVSGTAPQTTRNCSSPDPRSCRFKMEAPGLCGSTYTFGRPRPQSLNTPAEEAAAR